MAKPCSTGLETALGLFLLLLVLVAALIALVCALG